MDNTKVSFRPYSFFVVLENMFHLGKKTMNFFCSAFDFA